MKRSRTKGKQTILKENKGNKNVTIKKDYNIIILKDSNDLNINTYIKHLVFTKTIVETRDEKDKIYKLFIKGISPFLYRNKHFSRIELSYSYKDEEKLERSIVINKKDIAPYMTNFNVIKPIHQFISNKRKRKDSKILLSSDKENYTCVSNSQILPQFSLKSKYLNGVVISNANEIIIKKSVLNNTFITENNNSITKNIPEPLDNKSRIENNYNIIEINKNILKMHLNQYERQLLKFKFKIKNLDIECVEELSNLSISKLKNENNNFNNSNIYSHCQSLYQSQYDNGYINNNFNNYSSNFSINNGNNKEKELNYSNYLIDLDKEPDKELTNNILNSFLNNNINEDNNPIVEEEEEFEFNYHYKLTEERETSATICKNDYNKLNPKVFLNDNIINFYLK
jgi:hypothetical protein